MRMKRKLTAILILLGSVASASAQWQMQESHTQANLRGIHAVSNKVAWASGADGTILRTIDGGTTWTKCAVPPDGDKLDFRGIWSWNAQHATAMSAGPGDQSRIYETTDACAHWKEIARNTDKDGFWDAMVFQTQDFGMLGDKHTGVVIGDPISGRFDTRAIMYGGLSLLGGTACAANPGEAAFAASNSSVFVLGVRRYVIGTGGKGGPRVLVSALLPADEACHGIPVPLAGGSDSAGVFSVIFRDRKRGMIVGGDYKKPDLSAGTAAWSSDGGLHWTAATKPPHGFRSTVAWDVKHKAWIAAGTNGSDISRDDGRNWQPLDNGNWNALSLPFVVGPGGRIAKLEQAALPR